MISELTCLARKSDHKRESKCVPELLLKRYHKKVNVSIEIWHTTCILSEIIKLASRQLSVASNMDITYDNIHIKRTQLASINTSMGNKGSSIINIKQIHVCHQEE